MWDEVTISASPGRCQNRDMADDVGWSAGAGPDVHGSSSAPIRALTGRPVGDDELTGKGAVELYARLA